jgi:uncharacterized membrane protein YhaH (DUF805 family)
MTLSNLFLLDLGTTLLASSLAVIYLRRHLKTILIDLCGTSERANFWTAFSNVTLLLVPLIFAMSYQLDVASGTSPVLEMSQQLKWALIGLVVSVMLLGIVIGSFIPRQRALSPNPPTAH